MKILKALLSTSILLVYPFSQALAAPPGAPGAHLDVTQVFVIDADNPTSIMIIGTDLDFGSGPLSVTLGGFGPLNITGTPSSTMITVDFPAEIMSAGDYLLTVSNGNGQSQNDEYDLTIVAVGPPDVSIELCSLYGLTGFPAPPSLVSESPEATCDDGLDNDCDGDTDDADSDCAPPVACPCADIYDQAIATYTGAGGDLANGWDECAIITLDPEFLTTELTKSIDSTFISPPQPNAPPESLTVDMVAVAVGAPRVGAPRCEAQTASDFIFNPIFYFDRVSPISAEEYAACDALQAEICGRP